MLKFVVRPFRFGGSRRPCDQDSGNIPGGVRARDNKPRGRCFFLLAASAVRPAAVRE